MNHSVLHREVDGKWEAIEQGSPDTRPEMLVLQWTVRYSVVGGPEFVKKFQAPCRSLVFVPINCCRNIEISLRL